MRPSPSLHVWAAMGASALFVLAPLACFNPEVPGLPLGWIGLGALTVISTWLAMLAGALFPGSSGDGGRQRAGRLWLAVVWALIGTIVAGPWGAFLGLACFVAILAFRTPHLATRGRAGLLRTLLASGAASGALLLAVWLPRPAPVLGPLILIGVDGASWDIIDELRAEGRLPAFDRLVAAGTRGRLNVIEPSVSPALWTSIATGVSPRAHGIEDFWSPQSRLGAKRIWEIADEGGLTSGVLGYLVTWPPQKETGFLVPGWLAPGDDTIPRDLSFLRELERLEHSTQGLGGSALLRAVYASVRRGATLTSLRGLVGAIARPHATGEDPNLRDLDRRQATIALWTDVFCHLVRDYQPDLGIFYQHHVDAIEHLYFAHYRPTDFPDLAPDEQQRYRHAIPQMYEAMDHAIGRIESCTPPDTTLMVLSDHGQAPARSAWSGPMLSINTATLLNLLGVEDHFRGTNVGSQVSLRPISSDADFPSLLTALRSVATIAQGAPVFLVTEPRDERVVLRAHANIPPDERVRLGNREVPLSVIVDASGRLSGTHTNEAILLMSGPEIARGGRLPVGTGSLLDVAPTVLALLGLPVARDMEGRFIDEVLRAEVRPRFSVRYVDTYGVPEPGADAPDSVLDEATQRKLRSLGYLR